MSVARLSPGGRVFRPSLFQEAHLTMLTTAVYSLSLIGGADGPTDIVVGADAGALPVFGLFLILLNLVTFLVYGLDKYKARRELPRIAERTLLGLAVLGGSIGAWLGMRVFHHKTRHWYFRYGIPVIFLLQLALGFGLWYLLG